MSLSPEARCEGRQRVISSRGIDGTVDGFQGGSKRLAIFPCHEIHRVAQQMDDACLDHRFGEDGGDGVGEALQAIDDGQHDILDAAVAQFVHDAQPEFGALILLQRSEEHTSELQSLMRISYAVFCLKKKTSTYT